VSQCVAKWAIAIKSSPKTGWTFWDNP